MDRQSAISMQSSSGANAGAAVLEWLNSAFLMELLEDAPVAEHQPEDLDRLSRVIRSLEAEIGGGGGLPPSAAVADGGGKAADHMPGDVHTGGLEDYLLLDLDSIPGPSVAEAPLEFWTEVPPAVGHEHDMGVWYGDGVMVGYEFREQCYYGYSESPHVEQVYSPLWE